MTAPSLPHPAAASRLSRTVSSVEPRAALSTRRVRIALARSTAFAGLVFGAQSVPAVSTQLPLLAEPWAALVAGAVFAAIIAAAVTAVVDRGIRTSGAIVAGVYLLAVLTWPLLVTDEGAFADTTPWIWYLCTVATINAAIAFPLPVAVVYTLVTPVCYGLVRLSPDGGDVGLQRAGLDTVYAVILGSAALMILASMRQAARSVDEAQAAALAKYETAARQHATELERVQVDSIVHDSVLTTLLAAAGAETAEQRRLAARMARTALEHLVVASDAGQDAEHEVALQQLTRRIVSAASAFSAPFRLEASGLEHRGIPVQVAEAFHSATVQAMVNSMQHGGDVAHGVTRRLVIAGQANGCRIDVVDDGVGFDPAGIPHERLGIRVSISERMLSVGGSASIRSAPGVGTVITLQWAATPGEGPA